MKLYNAFLTKYFYSLSNNVIRNFMQQLNLTILIINKTANRDLCDLANFIKKRLKPFKVIFFVKKMDDKYLKYKNGAISKQIYKNSATEKTIQYLQKSGYTFIRSLGSGGYGTVIEFKEPKHKSSLAVKIVLKDEISVGEKTVWSSLQNSYILKLLSVQFIESAHTYIFVTPAHPYTLNHLLSNRNFLYNRRSLESVKNWLQDITNGLFYLHKNKCNHLDLKYNNVLISSQNTAIICDFTFLSRTEDFVTRYGSPIIFKPPETSINLKRHAAVDGSKYDVYTLGLLALDMFTQLSFSNEISKQLFMNLKADYWSKIMYPYLFRLLQIHTFTYWIQSTFPTFEHSYDVIDDIMNIILSCLHLNPARRPAAEELLQSKLFGGSEFWTFDKIWNNEANFCDVHTLIKKFSKEEAKRCAKIRKCGFKPADKKLINIGFRNKDSKMELKNSVLGNSETKCKKKINEIEVYEVKTSTKLKDTVDNEVEKCTETPVNHLISVIKDKSWASIVEIDYFSDAGIETKSEIESDDSSSFGLETLFNEVPLNDKNELPSQSLNKESHDSVLNATSNQGSTGKNQKMNYCQKLRSWWKRGKSVCCQILLRCVPCAKQKTKGSTT